MRVVTVSFTPLWILLGSCGTIHNAATVVAFQAPVAFRPATTTTTTTSSTSLRMMEHIDAATAVTSSVWHDCSILLSDAAEAVAKEDSGWWQNYLNFMKNSLLTVHNTIDAPLRDMGVTQTWGPSIFLFTAGVRTLLIPLSIQQSKSTEYTKALKPYQDEIKIKFADNKDMQNRAVAKLFEDAGTNPLSGCLFSFLQIPVFLGLYRGVTLLAKEGVIDEPFLWIPSLEGPVSAPNYRGLEWLTQGWTVVNNVPTPSLGWSTTLAFLVMPVVLVLGQKFTMTVLSPEPPDTSQMTPEEKQQNESSQAVLKFLPLLIGFFSLQVPAGLTIYWFTSNFFTLSQSLAVKAYFQANPPQIELPDYWGALDKEQEMSPEEKRKAAEAGLAAGPKFEDLLDEAKFHYVIERNPMREDSAAWARIQGGTQVEIPSELVSWVQADNGSGHMTTNGEAAATTEMESETTASVSP